MFLLNTFYLHVDVSTHLSIPLNRIYEGRTEGDNLLFPRFNSCLFSLFFSHEHSFYCCDYMADFTLRNYFCISLDLFDLYLSRYQRRVQINIHT